MRKISKLLLTLALFVFGLGEATSVYAGKTYASFSVAVGCTWDAGTNTMGFTAVNGWQILLTALPSGNISAYTNFHATLSSMSDNIENIRLRIKDTGDHYANVNLVAGENNIDLATLATANPSCDFTSIADITIWSPTSAAAGKTVDGENAASVVITDCYMSMPATLNFDATGKAVVNLTDLQTTGGLSFNSSTGVLSTDGTAGTLFVEFADPQDISTMKSFSVTRTGTDDIIRYFNMQKDDDEYVHNTGDWYSSKFGLSFNAGQAARATDVKKFIWTAEAIAKNGGESNEDYATRVAGITLNISEIAVQLNTIVAMNGSDVAMLPYKTWTNDGDNDSGEGVDASPTKNFGVYTKGVVFGSDDINNSKKYVDLTNYKKIIVRGYGSDKIRLFYNWQQTPQNKPQIELENKTGTVKAMEIDIPAFMTEKGISHFHLVGVKATYDQYAYVESISVTDGSETYDYVLSGEGYKLASAVEALADAKATSYNATGITAATALPTTNPNALIVANSGMVTNSQNVIVSGTCANLVLEDGHPFKAPADFTATAASYTTTINTTAKAGTLCLPFEATIPGGVEAWTLNYTAGKEAVKATEVTTTIPANTPVLLNGNGSADFTGSSVDIDADATNVSGALTGVFNATTVPENSYVLQNGTNGIGFYKVTSDNIVANPFRAYLTADGLGAPSLHIIFPEDSDVTGISEIEKMRNADNVTIFDLQGRKVAQPQKGLYIVNGKKVIFK